MYVCIYIQYVLRSYQLGQVYGHRGHYPGQDNGYYLGQVHFAYCYSGFCQFCDIQLSFGILAFSLPVMSQDSENGIFGRAKETCSLRLSVLCHSYYCLFFASQNTTRCVFKGSGEISFKKTKKGRNMIIWQRGGWVAWVTVSIAQCIWVFSGFVETPIFIVFCVLGVANLEGDVMKNHASVKTLPKIW